MLLFACKDVILPSWWLLECVNVLLSYCGYIVIVVAQIGVIAYMTYRPTERIHGAQGKLYIWGPCIQLTHLGNLSVETLSGVFC